MSFEYHANGISGTPRLNMNCFRTNSKKDLGATFNAWRPSNICKLYNHVHYNFDMVAVRNALLDVPGCYVLQDLNINMAV